MSPHTMYLDATLARCDWLQSYDITRSEWISCGLNKKKKRINNQRWQSIAGAIRVVSMILSMTGCVFLLVGRISTSSMLIDVLWFRKFLFGRCFFLSFQLVSFRCLELESDRRLLIGWRAAPFVVSTSFDCCRFAFVFLFPPLIGCCLSLGRHRTCPSPQALVPIGRRSVSDCGGFSFFL